MSTIKNAMVAVAMSGALLSTAAYAAGDQQASYQTRSESVQPVSAVKPMTQATQAKVKRKTQAIASYSNGADDAVYYGLVGAAGIAAGFAIGDSISH